MKVTISRFEYSGLLACAFLVWAHIMVGIKIVPHSAPLWDRLQFIVWSLLVIGVMLATAIAALVQLVCWVIAVRRKLDAP